MTGRRRDCLHLVCLLVVVLVVDCQVKKDQQKNRSGKKSDFNERTSLPSPPAPRPPPLPPSPSSSSVAAAAARILSRHKRIKKSTSVGRQENRQHLYPGGTSMTSFGKYAGGENGLPGMDGGGYDGEKDHYGRHRLRQKNHAKKPKMSLTMTNPYVSKGSAEALKKFKRSLAYYSGDYGRYDYNNNNRRRRKAGAAEKSLGDHRKMRGGSEFYSLAEAKNELDRRRRLIRKLEKRIKYDQQRLSKKKKNKKTMSAMMKTAPMGHSPGQLSFQTRPAFGPTVESIRDALSSTRALLQLKDSSRARGFYNSDRKPFLGEGGAVKTKIKKGNSPVKSI